MSNKQKILIIEDDAFLSKALQDKFVHEGFDVDIAVNGESGLQMLVDGGYNLALLDIMMPMKSGFEVLENMHADSKLSKIPVIVLSNLSQESDVKKVKDLGAKDYLVKSNTPLKDVVIRAKELILE